MGWAAWLQQELAYSNARLHTAARFAISICLVVAVGQWLRLPDYYWGLITVCVLVLPTAGAVLAKSLFRVAGTAAAALISVLLVSLLIQHHLAYCVTFFCLVAVLVYYATGKSAPYAFLICAMTIAVITFPIYAVPAEVEWRAPTRAFEVSLGVLIVAFVTLTFWPHFALDDLRESYCRSLEILADLHECLWRHLAAATPGREEFERVLAPARGGLRRRAALLEDAVWEDPGVEIRRDQIESQNFQLARLYAILYHVAPILDTPSPRALHLLARAECEALAQAVVSAVRNHVACIRGSRPDPGTPDLDAAMTALQQRLAQEELRTRSRQNTTTENLHSIAYISGLMESAELIGTLQTGHNRLRELVQRASWLLPLRRILDGLRTQTRRIEPEQVKKGVAAAVIYLLLFTVGQTGYLGSSTLAAVAALICLTWPTVGGGIQRALLVMVGTAIGCLAALAVMSLILPSTASLAGLLIGIAPVFLLVGYLLAGPPETAFIGLFSGIILCSVGFQNFAPPSDLAGFSNLLGGVLWGSVLGIAAQLCFLQQSAHQQVIRNMGACLRLLHTCFSRLRSLDRLPPSNPVGAMADIQRGMQFIGSLPGLNREARFELERGALHADRVQHVQAHLERLLLEMVSLASLSQQTLDQRLLNFSREDGLALKATCRELLEALAAYAESDSRGRYPVALLARLQREQSALEACIHETRHLCQDQSYGDARLIRALSYLEHLEAFASQLRETAETLRTSWPHVAVAQPADTAP
ncbi:MAG: FUSC family protein [Verrucomicrobiota bacterium]